MAAVNKVTHSSNKIDFEKGEPSKQKLRQKNTIFSDSEDLFVFKHGYGRWTVYEMIPASNLRKPYTLAVRAKKNILPQRRILGTLQ